MVVFAVPGSSPICWGVSSFYRLPRFPALIQFPLENSRPLQKNWWTNQKLRYIKSILPKQSCNNVQRSPYWNKNWVSPPSIMEPRLHIWWFLVPIIISFHLRHYKRSLRLTAPPWEERIPIASLWHHSGQICRSSCTGRMIRVVFVHLLSCFIRVRLGVKF